MTRMTLTGRMVALLLAITVAGSSAGGGLAAQDRPGGTVSLLAGTYEYVYEYNTPTLIENQYIVLEVADGGLRGWYYGTTDDFDMGREGYLPGFFVATMEDLSVVGESLAFTLRVSSEECFSKPVALEYRDPGQLPTDEYQRWIQTIPMEPRAYRGTITPDRIEMSVDGRPRSFSKIPDGEERIT
ncbi:hypothetical protein ACGF5M_05695 [Gemmatimonadota bacterium]